MYNNTLDGIDIIQQYILWLDNHDRYPNTAPICDYSTLYLLLEYSRPPNTADLRTDEKAAVFGNGRYWESYITFKTLIWDLEVGSGIGGEAVLGGAVLGGRLYHQLKE